MEKRATLLSYAAFPEPDKSSGPNSVENLYRLFRETNPPAAEKIDRFLRKLDEKDYSESDKLNITKAVKIATVAYQYNHNGNHFRKEPDAKGRKIPTLFHSLEMADRLVSEGNGLNWVVVSAMLFHDIPEDVKLIFIEKKKEKVIEKDAWFDILRNEFADTGKSELLIDLIKGVTEKPLPEGRQIRNRLDKTHLFRIIEGYVTTGRSKSKNKNEYLEGQARESVYEIVYNLENLMDSALKSPEHLQILVMKITDIWHNFQSPDWIKNTKVLRARLAANIAEWMGWYSMRDDLIFQLSQIADTLTPYAAISVYETQPGPKDRDLEEYIDTVDKIITHFNDNNDTSIRINELFAGFPVAHIENKFSRWQETTLPPPEVIVKTTRSAVTQIKKTTGLSHYMTTDHSINGKIRVSLDRQKNLFFPESVNYFGRLREDFKVKCGNYQSFNLRLESDEPYLIDVFQNHSGFNFQHVPEGRGLFHNDLKNTSLWNLHISSLIGFLYEPSIVMNYASQIYFINYNKKLYFISGNTSLSDFCHVINRNPLDLKIINYYDFELNIDKPDVLIGNINPFTKSRKNVPSRVFYLS